MSFIHVHSQNRGKLDPRAIKCIFVGYSSTQKGYKCYHPSSRKFYIYANVTFHESESYFTTPYLQDKDVLLLDLSSFSLKPNSNLPSIDPVPSSNVESPNIEHVARDNSAPNNIRYTQVYSRKKLQFLNLCNSKNLIPTLE